MALSTEMVFMAEAPDIHGARQRGRSPVLYWRKPATRIGTRPEKASQRLPRDANAPSVQATSRSTFKCHREQPAGRDRPFLAPQPTCPQVCAPSARQILLSTPAIEGVAIAEDQSYISFIINYVPPAHSEVRGEA